MTPVRRRRAPLTAERPTAVPTPPPPVPDLDAGIGHALETTRHTEEDRRRFALDVRALRTRGGLALGERTLMVVGGIIAPLGLLFVLLGWVGASRTPNLFEQVPYLISGGLFGLGLVFLGAFFYFTHWVTELVKETRTHSAALLDAIEGLRADVVRARGAAATTAPGHVQLVVTERGSMVHRPDCVVVVGKGNVHSVDDAAGLRPCKLCDPLSSDN